MSVTVARGRAAKRHWLRRLAEELEPRAGPYYLHAPRSIAEPAPGWYWIPATGDCPEYLGASAFHAEAKLRGLLEAPA